MTEKLIPIIAVFAAVVGILFKYVLFNNKKNERVDKEFKTSEYLLDFFIELIIFTISCALGFYLTGRYEYYADKKEITHMVEDCVEMANKEFRNGNSVLFKYNNKKDGYDKFSQESLIDYVHLNLEYYGSIINNTDVIKYMNHDAHYYAYYYYTKACQYSRKLEQTRNIKDAYSYLTHMVSYEGRMIDSLEIGLDEMMGKIDGDRVKEENRKVKEAHSEQKEITSYYEPIYLNGK